jgi:holliday junction DNA helicase RuvB
MARPPFQIGEFVGMRKTIEPILRRQDGAASRGEPLPHHLFIGVSGLGKSLLVRTLAQRVNAKTINIRCDVPASEIESQLQSLEDGDFAFFDEAHRLAPDSQESLYVTMDQIALRIKSNAVKETNDKAKIAAITLTFATDQPGRLMNALIKRIPETVRLRFYNPAEMKEIVARIAARLKMLLSPQAARQLACICNGIPRRAEQRVNDVRLYFCDSHCRQLGSQDVSEYLAAHPCRRT